MSATAAASRITRLFEVCSADKRKAFIAYLTAGDPGPAATVPLVLALERGGADLIELGVPFSDPIADGPVIQRASERALENGTTVMRILEMVRQIRKQSQIPLLLFSYLNPLMHYGFEALARDAAEAGIDGILLTDLSVEEAEAPVRRIREQSLDAVFLAAPTSSERRLELVGKHSSGFVYLVSRTVLAIRTSHSSHSTHAPAHLAAPRRRFRHQHAGAGGGRGAIRRRRSGGKRYCKNH
jgi:tryptophan synthase alpha chain